FFPNASHWAELMRPFRAFSQIVNGYLVFGFQQTTQQLNNSTIQQSNDSTTQQLNNSTIHFDRISISLFL
ncbi:hypothetical protein, partial [Tannerella forsythia]|uniref:hypothetical protein n=1 Tax=Tannerella forsythia TaxID=28112 RepID=UPI00242E9BEC